MSERIYLLTMDLFEYTKACVRSLNPNLLDQKAIKKFEEKIKNTLVRRLPYPVECLECEKLKEELKEREKESPYAIISLDRIYSSQPYKLEINRLLVYEDGTRTVLGPRPFYPSIEDQVSNLTKKIKDKEIALSDVGTWTGSTIIELKELFDKFGYQVKEVILAISTRSGKENLKRNGMSVKVWGTYELYDWIEMRDFLIGGRVVGENNLPLLYRGKTPVRIPYWSDSFTLKEWASVPEEVSEDIRNVCIETTKEYLDYLSQVKGKDITIEDIGLLVPYGMKPNQIMETNLPTDIPLINAIEKLFEVRR